MNTKKQLFSTVLFVLIGTAMASAQSQQQTLTFEDALQIMQERNPALQQAREQIKQKEYEQKVKRALYMPQISVSAKAVAMSDMLHLDLTPVQDAITPLYNTLGNYGVFSGLPNPDPASNALFPLLPDNMSTAVIREKLLEGGHEISNANWDQVIQEKNFATLTADFVWPVLTGGKIKAANQAAGIETDISNEKLRVTEGVLLSELVTRYYGLSLGIQVKKVREQMFVGMENHYADAQKLFDNGMIAKVELLHANVSRNEAQRELKQAERNIDIIQTGLASTLFYDIPTNLFPASQLFMNIELSEDSYWIDQANSLNPQLLQIDRKKDLIQIKNKVDKGNYLPTVAMLGTYNLAEKNLSPYLPDWMVGVGLKWNIFEGMGRNNKMKAGETMHNQANFAKQKANSDLQAYITKLYEELQMQMEQKEDLEITLELASEYAKSTEKAFREGFATSTSVVDAQTKVAQVKVLRLKLFYEYDVTLAKLMQTAGMPEQYINYCSGENTIYQSLSN